MSKATEVLAMSAAHSMDVAASAANGVANSKTVSSLDNALATMINSSVQATGDAIAWAKGQIPDVIHQLLMWKAVESAVIFCVFALLFTICTYFVVWAILKANQIIKNNRSASYGGKIDPDGMVIIAILLIIADFSFLLVTCVSLDWLKIWLAPKIYLIEYAAKLVKG